MSKGNEGEKVNIMDNKLFNIQFYIKWISITSVLIFSCGAAYKSINDNEENIIKLDKKVNLGFENADKKIDDEVVKFDEKLDRKSVNDRALTYKYSAAQKDRIDKMEAILLAQEKSDARMEIHLQYQSKGIDELKVSMKELEKKKYP